MTVAVLEGCIGVRSAARRLHLSEEHVRQLVDWGTLRGTRVARRRVVGQASVEAPSAVCSMTSKEPISKTCYPIRSDNTYPRRRREGSQHSRIPIRHV
jgi:hypothetical protein